MINSDINSKIPKELMQKQSSINFDINHDLNYKKNESYLNNNQINESKPISNGISGDIINSHQNI